MSSDFDATEFVDGDFQSRKSPHSATPASSAPLPRAPTREEVDAKVAGAQQKLAELKRAQEELERERSALEETRRRQMEFQAGRQEMIQHLTRGLGLLEEAEFAARRDAEQMSKALVDLREALGKVQAIREESWSQEQFTVELTRALTVLENARMEWNSARLKFPVLAAPPPESTAGEAGAPPGSLFATYTLSDLCRIGFAMTWPVMVAVLLGAAALVAVVLSRHG